MGSKALQAMAVRPDSQSRPLACYLGWLFASLVVPCSEISELRYSYPAAVTPLPPAVGSAGARPAGEPQPHAQSPTC